MVVLESGSALAVDQGDAILEAWYPGESGGAAIAETLAGRNNPAGKLPVTFYRSVADLPAFEDYSMKNRTYRYFTGTPLYPFGYGLSYTQFAYSGLRLSGEKIAAGQPLMVEGEVHNTGRVAGDAVAELYLTPPSDGLAPKLQLAAFDRVSLAPGESKKVRFTLEPRQMSMVDARGQRAVRAGIYRLALGGGQPENAPGAQTTFTIMGEQELPK